MPEFTPFQWLMAAIGAVAVIVLWEIRGILNSVSQRIGAVETAIKNAAMDAETERRQIREELSGELSSVAGELQNIHARIERVIPNMPDEPP